MNLNFFLPKMIYFMYGNVLKYNTGGHIHKKMKAKENIDIGC